MPVQQLIYETATTARRVCVNVEGRGNCFFLSIVDQLEDIGPLEDWITAEALRERVALKAPELLKDVYGCDYLAKVATDLSGDCNDVGEEAMLACAVTLNLRLHVCVLPKEHDQVFNLVYSPKAELEPREVWIALYRDHYLSLRQSTQSHVSLQAVPEIEHNLLEQVSHGIVVPSLLGPPMTPMTVPTAAATSTSAPDAELPECTGTAVSGQPQQRFKGTADVLELFNRCQQSVLDWCQVLVRSDVSCRIVSDHD